MSCSARRRGIQVHAQFDLRPVGEIGGGAGIFEGQVLDVLGHDLEVGHGRLALAAWSGGSFAAHDRSFLIIAARALPWIARPADKRRRLQTGGKRRFSGPFAAARVGRRGGAADISGFLMPDSQTLGLLVAAMVAGVVCSAFTPCWAGAPATNRRRRPQPPPDRRRSPAAAAGAAGLHPTACWISSSPIPASIRPSSWPARATAYSQIVTAFAAGDRAALRPLLSPTSMPLSTPASRRAPRPAPRLIKLHDARIVGSALHGRSAEITVAFTAEFPATARARVTDVWTFERNLDSTDPNWTLVATSGELPE